MHNIEMMIGSFLQEVCHTPQNISEELIEKFGEQCKQSLRKHFTEERDRTFRLRMSNIGRDIRQLQMEKEHGSSPMAVPFLLRVFHGDLLEAFTVFILKAAGLNVTAHSKKVALDVEGTTVEGTLDIDIGDVTYDVKSASRWAFENKFKDINTLAEGDDFGYIPQIYGYAEAEGKKAGGFIVINKDTTEIKVVSTPDNPVEYEKQRQFALTKIKNTVTHFKDNLPLPPCPGVEWETFRSKPTGAQVLGDKCRWCPRKDKCWPGVTQEPARSSSAKNPGMKYYIPNACVQDNK